MKAADKVQDISTLGMEETNEDARSTYVGLEIGNQEKLAALLQDGERLLMQYDYSDLGKDKCVKFQTSQ